MSGCEKLGGHQPHYVFGLWYLVWHVFLWQSNGWGAMDGMKFVEKSNLSIIFFCILGALLDTANPSLSPTFGVWRKRRDSCKQFVQKVVGQWPQPQRPPPLLYLGEGGHGSDIFSFIAHSSEPSLCSGTQNMLIYWVICVLANDHSKSELYWNAKVVEEEMWHHFKNPKLPHPTMGSQSELARHG